MQEADEHLLAALQGDINAFQQLFSPFERPLRSYLFRLLANQSDADDLTHDTFIRAFNKLTSYNGESSLKTWVFQIATHLAYTYLARRKRWTPDVLERAKQLVSDQPALGTALEAVHQTSPAAHYEMREHINTCFCCMAKTLPIENQVVLMLKDVYSFSIQEISRIMAKTDGVVKYLLQDARQIMIRIFEARCALISKQGVCHQCSELNGWFNAEQDQQQALLALSLVKASTKYNRAHLYRLRAQLVKAIDPLNCEGTDLQTLLLNCSQLAMEEEDGRS